MNDIYISKHYYRVEFLINILRYNKEFAKAFPFTLNSLLLYNIKIIYLLKISNFQNFHFYNNYNTLWIEHDFLSTTYYIPKPPSWVGLSDLIKL